MSRLVVVSNRVTPITGNKATTAGWLADGVLTALHETGGIWFGWSGETIESGTPIPKIVRSGNITYITIDLLQAEYDRYDGGFANRTLWPLFHYRLDLSRFNRDWYVSYRRVNQWFAEQLYPYLRDDDLIWVHDYHLIPLGEELRQLGIKGRIGFFLHAPFPPAEVYVALPWHDRLMESLSNYDLVGLQLSNDLRNFYDYLYREGVGYAFSDGLVHAFGRTLRSGVFPIGIDTANFARMATSGEAVRAGLRLARSLLGRKLIIGVDRFDYTKGIAERLRAYEALLQNYPRQRGQVTFVQVSAPSRETVAEYAELGREIAGIVGHINGQFSEFDWTPLRYLNRGFTRGTLSGFFRASRIGLVTSLRDSMNLVAKEYVAAQSEEDPGVLVLSRFAGAAEELDSAVIVNPYDTEATAEAMHLGLMMPLEERQDRWRRLFSQIQEHDVATWRQAFLSALSQPYGDTEVPIAASKEHSSPGFGQTDGYTTPERASKSRKKKSIEYYSCFLSHSSEDLAFVKQLYLDLDRRKVKCFFSEEDLKIGQSFRDTIERGIRVQDKLLLILSESSIASNWVADEVEAAFEEERKKEREILFPVRIDAAILHTDRPWALAILRKRHIGDFARWQDPDAYRSSLRRLLRDLRKENAGGIQGVPSQ